MTRLDARQFRRQGPALGLHARGLARIGRLKRFKFRFHRSDVARHDVVEQGALLGIHAFGARCELDAAQPCDLRCQRGDLGVLVDQVALARF
jgi:hypothetical protein